MKILLKIFSKAVILIFFYCSTSIAGMQGTLELDIKRQVFSNGDIIDSRLLVGPWEEGADIDFLKKYLGKTFLEYFYIIDVGNADIVNNFFRSDLRMVIKKSFSGQESALLFFHGQEVPIRIIKNQFVAGKKDTESFILFEQFEKKDRAIYYALIMALVGSGFIIFWQGNHFYKKRKRRMKEARENREAREQLLHLMKNVKRKKDIQELYARRDQMKYLFSNSRQFKEVLAMMDEHQYKNHLSEHIIIEIREKLVWTLDR